MVHSIDFPEEWFDTDAPEGVWLRFRHPSCSEGKNKALGICKTGNGWSWHCHRCGKSGFKSASNLSPKEMMKWLKSANEKAQDYKKKVELPEDFTTTIPGKGLAWLYGKGVTDEQIKRFGFGYSRYYDRVIMPVYDYWDLIYWEGRYLGKPDKYHPKYMKVRQVGRKDIYFKVEGNYSKTVVLVEDILSAINVGEVVDCYAMLYAFVPDDVVFALSKQYQEIVVWLDPDKEQDLIKYATRYRSFGINLRTLKTKKDPKDYKLKEIESLMKGGQA